ncbi:hypothetical protein BU17DRAFT_70594 [Hysterangium stoloniferum]|nr:hypothetical protein BU17DRAFT_70594 [Hysterangium stoloniferum]
MDIVVHRSLRVFWRSSRSRESAGNEARSSLAGFGGSSSGESLDICTTFLISALAVIFSLDGVGCVQTFYELALMVKRYLYLRKTSVTWILIDYEVKQRRQSAHATFNSRAPTKGADTRSFSSTNHLNHAVCPHAILLMRNWDADVSSAQWLHVLWGLYDLLRATFLEVGITPFHVGLVTTIVSGRQLRMSPMLTHHPLKAFSVIDLFKG